jgi:hypothetical protein
MHSSVQTCNGSCIVQTDLNWYSHQYARHLCYACTVFFSDVGGSVARRETVGAAIDDSTRVIAAHPARTQLTNFTRICPAWRIYYPGTKQSAGARSCFPAEAQPSLRRGQTKSRARLRPNRSESSRTDQFQCTGNRKPMHG